MKAIHHHLCKKSRVYHRWHEHPLHPHVHWGVLGSVVLGVALSFVILGWSEVEVARVQVARAASLAGVDGLTFAARKSAYLNSFQGQDDPANLSPVGSLAVSTEMDRRVDLLFGWLERCATDSAWSQKCSEAVVTETIQYFVGSGYWIHLGPKAQRGFAIIIPIKYEGVISQTAFNAVIARYRDRQVGQNDVYTVENENKLIMSAVGLYLYAEYFDPNATLTVYGCNTQCTKTWPSFTYNGVTYTNGMTGNFRVMEIMKGFIVNFVDEWMLANKGIRGQREFDSLTYHRLYPEAMMILATFARDTGMKNRGKMAGDLIILDALMDFSANSWGGTLGRTDYRKLVETPRFPFRVLFGLSSNETEWDILALYALNYAPPDVIVSLSKFDESWRFHKEYNQELHVPGKGKWNYLTSNYNIGSNVGSKNSGWQVNVKGSGAEQFIRFFINADPTAPSPTQEGTYLGDKGNQLKNAMFVSLSGTAKLWEFPNGASWQSQSNEAGKTGNTWDFRQLNNSYVAIQLKGNQAAIEVADASDGYASLAAFKAAVKANADLTSSGFTTSKNQRISIIDNCGLNQPGDCVFPFDRMETESSVGKLIDWQMTPNGPLMVVKKGTLTCNYAFGSWTYNGNGCGASSGGTTNQPPSNLVLRYLGPTPTGGNLCGNGTINTGEQCDGSNLNNQTCQSLGFTGGTPACYPAGSANQCTFNTSGCTGGTTCNNNGIKEGTERCDGTQLGGATCPAGTTGTPTCSNCTLSYSACTPIGGTGSWNHTYPRLAYQHFRDSPPDWNALFDLVVITRPVAETAVTAKAINPNTKFIFTRSITAYGANQKQKRVIDCPDWTDQWYVLRSDGSQALTQGRNQPLLDLTNLAPLNSKGERYNQHIPKCFDTWMREVGFDGAGTDWMWISPTEATGNIDFNRNGQNDYNEAGKGTAWVNQTWLTGLQTLLNNWRADLGANPPLWLNSGTLHTNSDIPNVMSISNGLEFERQGGHRSFSRELGIYDQWTSGGRKPSVWITDTYPLGGDNAATQRGGNTKNYYELMRMMLAFTMLGDGYFQYNPREGGEHHFYDYYDEFDLKRSMPGYPKGLLGDPFGAAVALPNGAMARFFQGGVVIENPTSASITVTSSQLAAVDSSSNKTYYRFRGNQDPTFNNGQQFTSVTLTGHSVGAYSVGDGIILVRESDLNKRTVIADIIVDNVDDFTSPGSTGASFTGAWADPPLRGVNAILTNWSAWTHDNDTGRGTYAFRYLKGAIGNAFYHPTINVPGQYEVFEWHSDLSKTGVDIDGATGESSPGNPDSAVTYQVTHAGGTAAKTVNQALNPGLWNSLGTYQFTGASSQGVRILGDGSSNVIQADAIKFVCRFCANTAGGAVAAAADTSFPALSSLSITQGSVNADWTATDDKGLARVELWSAVDLNNTPDATTWKKVTEQPASGTTASGRLTDATAGTYWFGVHIVDQAGNCITELGKSCGGALPTDQTIAGRTNFGTKKIIVLVSGGGGSCTKVVAADGSGNYSSIQQAADGVQAGDTVCVKRGVYTGFRVERKNGTVTAPIVFKPFPGDESVVKVQKDMDSPTLQIVQGVSGYGRRGVIEVLGSSYVRIEGFEVIDLGAYGPDEASLSKGYEAVGIWVDHFDPYGQSIPPKHITIKGNHIHDIGAHGIWSMSHGPASTIHTNYLNLIPDTYEFHGADNSYIDNVIHDVGKSKFANGVYVGGQNIAVRGNTVYRAYGAGIIIWSGLDTPAYTALQPKNVVVENNIIHDNGHADFGGKANNIRGRGIDARMGSGFTIRNNVVYRNFEEGIKLRANSAVLLNNTVYGNNTGSAVLQRYGIAIDAGSGASAKNNISFGNAGGRDLSIATDTICSNSVYGTLTGGACATSVTGDPLFVNAAAGDFHLRTGSPAIDRGSSISGFSADHEGTARPQGSAWDIGAYEYRSTLVP